MEFSVPRIKRDLEYIDGWLNGQFKDNQDLEHEMRKSNGLNP